MVLTTVTCAYLLYTLRYQLWILRRVPGPVRFIFILGFALRFTEVLLPFVNPTIELVQVIAGVIRRLLTERSRR